MNANVIGAFSEDQASLLAGVSKRQLAQWDKENFLRPSYSGTERGGAFARVYSFRDLVELRVLHQLRNEHRIEMSHLKAVYAKLSSANDKRWGDQKLWVVNRRVVWENPRSKRRGKFSRRAASLSHCIKIC